MKYKYSLKMKESGAIKHVEFSEDENHKMNIPKNWGYVSVGDVVDKDWKNNPILAKENNYEILKEEVINLVPAYSKERRKRYHKEGIDAESMVVALWEKLMENRPEAADALQLKRLDIKLHVPKP